MIHIFQIIRWQLSENIACPELDDGGMMDVDKYKRSPTFIIMRSRDRNETRRES